MAMFGGGGFDANQFAGGGFMPTQQDAGQGGYGSGGKGRQTKEQTLRAVTIRQLVMATASAGPHDQDIVMDNHDLSNVTVLGKVVSVGDRGGQLDLEVSDGTGVAQVESFLNIDADPQVLAQKKAELQPGTYVRVYGHLKPFDGRRVINAFAVRVVHDFNEVTYHFLQAVFQHLHLSKDGGAAGAAGAGQQPGGYGGGGGGGGGGVYGGGAAGNWQQPQHQPAPGGYGAPPPAAAAAAAAAGMDPCQAAVLTVIADPSVGDGGMHENDICARLAPQGFGRPQVEAALQFLQNEAHAYTTTDEHTWRAP